MQSSVFPSQHTEVRINTDNYSLYNKCFLFIFFSFEFQRAANTFAVCIWKKKSHDTHSCSEHSTQTVHNVKFVLFELVHNWEVIIYFLLPILHINWGREKKTLAWRWMVKNHAIFSLFQFPRNGFSRSVHFLLQSTITYRWSRM